MRRLSLPRRLALCVILLSLLACGPFTMVATSTPPGSGAPTPERNATSTRAVTPSPTPAPSGTPVPTGSVTGAIACPEATISAIAALQAGDIPEYFQQEDAEKRGGEIDVMDYFTVLEHVSVEPSYVIDYVYRFDGMGGSPVLYARKADEPAYRNFSEYERARSAEEDTWLNHVQADGSREGYLELAVLSIMAGQFYLFWHAGYNDTEIICSAAKLEDVVSSAAEASFGNALIPEAAATARALDVTPHVELRGDEAVVELVAFTKWGGFFRGTFTLQREFPHKFGETDWQVLVPYDCGIMF